MATNWRDHVAREDREAMLGGGYGGSVELGSRPALLVVDATYGFTGRPELAPEENARRYPKSAPAPAATALPAIVTLLAAFRRAGLPAVLTTNHGRRGAVARGLWSQTTSGHEEEDADDVVEAVEAEGHGIVLAKSKPSAFFASPLVPWLHTMAVDSLLVVGGTTSGCVRATVVDAFSYNYPTWVVEDGVFDRSHGAHVANLFDMSMKYADVVGLEAALEALGHRAAGVSAD